ncbi:MAG: C4-dicarboxylate ABC transporter [Betaproteobacteria bacterium]|nr:C4-dicarboxylate ABC transporter [Betaproteobacteria bacterium]
MTMNSRIGKIIASLCVSIAAVPAMAAEVTLKVHFFLPLSSFANTLFITPWCEKIAKDSNDRMKCQIYPSMQLGGTPPQLFEQVRDGVADVVWTLPGYTAGRFPSVEVFSRNEFKDVRPLAFHVHGDGVFHTTNKQIRTAADLKGMKLRAPTRMTNKYIAALGATPVSMPVPQVGDALSKGVIDGAVVPYEVVPAVKIQELVKYHTETDPAEPAFYTSTFIFAMNRAKYDALPPDLKKVIDQNSGQALSGQIGKAFLAADVQGKKLTAKNTTYVIPKSELEGWKKTAQPLISAWVSEMNGKGFNGQQMLDTAKALIAKHSATK